jgi:hypothetical protein
MNSIGISGGLLTVDYKNSLCIVTILQDPSSGKLVSVLVDDGDEVMEYNYAKTQNSMNYGSDPLQWGLFA